MKRPDLFLVTAVALSLSCGPRTTTVETVQEKSFSAEEIEAFLPARLRRLSNAEYEATVEALLGLDTQIAKELPPNLEVDGYSRNDVAPVSSLLSARLQKITRRLSTEFVEKRPDTVLCTDAEEVACARTFIDAFAPRALRRPLSPDERSALLSIYQEARLVENSHDRALSWIISTLLQSPSLLYVSEKGAPTKDPSVRYLSSHEAASVLSYMLQGGPPDEELRQAADSGALLSGEERRRQALRLLSQWETRHQFRRFVTEWLEIGRLSVTSKDERIAPHFEDLKSHMQDETSAFVDEVMVRRGASLSALLTAGFSSVDPTMARFYDLDAWGPRVPTEHAGRIGLLQQASFLSAHAHPDGSSPIKRGDFVLRRILCVDMPRPDELGIEVVIPEVTTTETTRARFSAHVQNDGCAACHDIIDPLGFSFENFDAAGHFREKENGFPIRAKGSFEYEGMKARFSDSAELSRWLAAQPESPACFRRHALRFFAASGQGSHANAFESLITDQDESKRASLIENLVTYAGSDLFLYRKVLP